MASVFAHWWHFAKNQLRAHGPDMRCFVGRFSGLIVWFPIACSLCMLSSRTVWLHPMRRRRRLGSRDDPFGSGLRVLGSSAAFCNRSASKRPKALHCSKGPLTRGADVSRFEVAPCPVCLSLPSSLSLSFSPSRHNVQGQDSTGTFGSAWQKDIKEAVRLCPGGLQEAHRGTGPHPSAASLISVPELPKLLYIGFTVPRNRQFSFMILFAVWAGSTVHLYQGLSTRSRVCTRPSPHAGPPPMDLRWCGAGSTLLAPRHGA